MKKLRYRPPPRPPINSTKALDVREFNQAIQRMQDTAPERARLHQLRAVELKQQHQYLVDAGFTVAEAFQLLLADVGRK